MPGVDPNNQVKQVKKNMAKPEALLYRGNSGNAGYGFEQVLKGTDLKN